MKPLIDCTAKTQWTLNDNLELSRHYNDGDWDWIQDRLGRLIDQLTCKQYPSFDLSRVTFSVIFLNEILETPNLARVLVHRPRPEVFGSRVPGYALYDLQLIADSRLFVISHYQATPTPNPLIAQIPSVLSQISGGLSKAVMPPSAVSAFDGSAKTLCEIPFSPKPLNSFVVHLVTLPPSFKPIDASIPQVSVTDQLSSADVLDYTLNSARVRSQEEDSRAFATIHCDQDKCGLSTGKGPMTILNDKFCHLLAAPASKCLPQPSSKCPPPPPPPAISLPSLCPTDQPTCVNSLEVAVSFLADTIQTTPGVDQSAAEDFGSRLYSTYVGLASQSQPATATLTTQYTFGRLTRFAFSLGAAGILKTSLNKPVKVNPSTNTLIDAPPTELLTFVALDYHPWPYDETEFSQSPQERFRFFGGVAVTPNAGLVAGLGYGILRGLTLECGYGLLLANVLRDGEIVGGPAAPKNPTPRGRLGVLFIGIGYSLQ